LKTSEHVKWGIFLRDIQVISLTVTVAVFLILWKQRQATWGSNNGLVPNGTLHMQ